MDIWDVNELDSDDASNAETLYSQLEYTLLNYRQLSQDYKELVEEVTRLRHANHVLSALKLGVSCRNDLAASLPAEILLMIFRHALPPRWMFSDAKSRLPCPTSIWSTDRHMKLSVLAVCKSWHGVGNELLYESVVLYRITQLPLFVRALEAREGLGSLVKHLDIDCFVPRGYSKLHETESKQILELCPNLSHIGFSPVFWIPENPCVIPTMNSSITSLHFSSDTPYSAILPALAQFCSSLKSLAITIPGADDHYPILTFNKLKALHLTLEWYSAPSTSNWRTPALRRLHLSDENLGSFVTADARRRRTETLLDAHGRTVTFLRLSQHHLTAQEHLDRCPVLEYLVLSYVPRSIEHPKLKFLDVLSCENNVGDEPTLWRARFPSLRGCRRLDSTTGLLRAVPLPVESGQDEDEAVHPEEADDGVTQWLPLTAHLPVLLGFSDGAVNGRLVHWVDNSDDYVFDADDDDGGSVDSSESEDSGSDAVTVSEDGGYLDDPFYEGDEWEIGRDEAIGVFDRTPGS
ncbi:hypothetical protein DFH06DRAFT_1290582 [Mycena polygramma]|nr:hypothetical protein DFH06DRAFT_1290582 [Mycena polygramma]